MNKHRFGIMTEYPEKDKRYEPNDFDCISIDDIYISPILYKFAELKTYWHTFKWKKRGLSYYGVTIIPPESLAEFMDIISEDSDVCELTSLLLKAQEAKKFVIHFGV